MNRPKDRASFEKELFEFLRANGHSNIKIPMIGQKELNLFTLYNAVISRGGAENVSSNKLWKDIVNEFDLPATCTSASFTLKNHYQKYLLAYEQKFFFKKNDSEMIKELGNIRQKRIKTDCEPGILMKVSEQQNIGPQTWQEKTSTNVNLEQMLKEAYEERNANEQIFFVKRKRLVPFSTEIKRIILAFESKIASEVRFALNALLFYSCSKQMPFYLENYRVIYNEFLNYFEYILSKIEGTQYMFKEEWAGEQNPIQKNNPFINQNTGINGKSESSDIKNEQELQKNSFFSSSQSFNSGALKLSDTILYVDKLPLSELLEQLKIILSIFRNLIFIKVNETFMNKEVKLIKLFYKCHLNSNDAEIAKSTLEIFSVLSRYIILSDKPSQYEKHYFDKIIISINSENEFELGVENLHNLMINQENENIIEVNLNRFLGALVKLLTCNSMDVVERVLEIICHFSDLKISTRVLFAKQPHFFQRLIAIIAGNSSRCHEKLTRIAALIINNIIVTPAARVYLKPFEEDIFLIASADEKM